jgi:hypothetical protein
MNKPIYIYQPQHESDSDLWRVVKDYDILEKQGSIGDCLMRDIAQRESLGTYSVLNMEFVARRAAFELLKRLSPEMFG